MPEKVTTGRAAEPGFVQVLCRDGRRGFWYRRTPGAIEMCAGREGDDTYVCLYLPPGALLGLEDLLDDVRYAAEAGDDLVGALNARNAAALEAATRDRYADRGEVLREVIEILSNGVQEG